MTPGDYIDVLSVYINYDSIICNEVVVDNLAASNISYQFTPSPRSIIRRLAEIPIINTLSSKEIYWR